MKFRMNPINWVSTTRTVTLSRALHLFAQSWELATLVLSFLLYITIHYIGRTKIKLFLRMPLIAQTLSKRKLFHASLYQKIDTILSIYR